MVHIKKRALWLVATVLSMFDKGVRDMRVSPNPKPLTLNNPQPLLSTDSSCMPAGPHLTAEPSQEKLKDAVTGVSTRSTAETCIQLSDGYS